ncbi:TPA: plasmid transfer ATPase TraJ [Pseudomonas aeruginosa]
MSDLIEFPPYDFRGELTGEEFKRFLKYCADQGASDILIQGGDYPWVEIQGRQRKAALTTIKQGQLSSLIASVWKSEVETQMRAGEGADRALEISGESYGIARGEYLRFRCNFIQARVARIDEAYSITLRVIPSDLPDIQKMGLEQDLFEELYPGKGMILICGPTGSGKTTLLAGVYAYAGSVLPDRKVITYEDPIEYVLGGKHWLGPQPAQSQLDRDVKSFSEGIKLAMRRKPSIIGIGEARDLPTVDAVIDIALSGHLCFATLHTESCAETINRMIQQYPPAQQAAVASRLLGCLRVVVVQRLLKTTDGKRVAIREYVVFDRDLRNELEEISYEKWAPFIRRKLEGEKQTMEDKAWALLKQGRIAKPEFVELAGAKAFHRRINEESVL